MSNPYLEEMKKVRKAINTFAKNQTDETIIDNKAAFPFWNGNGLKYVIDDIVRYNDKVYRVILAHTSQLDWTPDVAVSLFVEISLEEFPEWKQPEGAHDAYKLGAKCSHNGKHWICTYDNNIYEPGVYGWDEIKE